MIGTSVIKTNRGLQWDRSQVVPERVGSTGKRRLKSEGYHYNQNEERNPLE
jgi:hypothetical protein